MQPNVVLPLLAVVVLSACQSTADYSSADNDSVALSNAQINSQNNHRINAQLGGVTISSTAPEQSGEDPQDTTNSGTNPASFSDKRSNTPSPTLHCSAPPPIENIWKLEPLVQKKGLFSDGMNREQRAEVIRKYIRKKNTKFLACNPSK